MVVSDFCLRPARLCFATPSGVFGGGNRARGPAHLGSSRFALVIASSAPKGAGGIAVGPYELFAGMIEFGLSRRLSRIVTVTDLHMERILRRAGWPLERIGEPHTICITRALAGYLKVSKRYCTWCGETVALAVRCYERRCFAASHDLSTRLDGQGSAVVPTSFATETDPPHWWDERSYDYTAQLTLRGWAWELLRRNPAFQRDLLAALRQANNLSRGASVAVIASAGDLSRWGVLFR